MSLAVSVYTREGIVMAADSRLTLTFQRIADGQQPHTVSVTSSDSARKLFLTPNQVGISAFGAADVKGVPIAGLIESFIDETLKDQALPPKETAEALLSYFLAMGAVQESSFHVCGYRAGTLPLQQEAVFLNVAYIPLRTPQAPRFSAQ